MEIIHVGDFVEVRSKTCSIESCPTDNANCPDCQWFTTVFHFKGHVTHIQDVGVDEPLFLASVLVEERLDWDSAEGAWYPDKEYLTDLIDCKKIDAMIQ